MRQPPIPCPNVDLGAEYRIIDETVDPPVWRTLHTGYATAKTAQSVIRRFNLPGVWQHDFCGETCYIVRTPA